MGPTPVYGARANHPPPTQKNADFAMKQTNVCRRRKMSVGMESVVDNPKMFHCSLYDNFAKCGLILTTLSLLH